MHKGLLRQTLGSLTTASIAIEDQDGSGDQPESVNMAEEGAVGVQRFHKWVYMQKLRTEIGITRKTALPDNLEENAHSNLYSD